jgi:hypothetical protein
MANQMHARNRGWMNLFRRWSQTATFRRYWAPSIADYSDGLQNFCRHVLGLRVGMEWVAADPASFTPTERRTVNLLRGFPGAAGFTWRQARARSQSGRDATDAEDADGPAPAGPGFPIALAAVENDPAGPILRAFRLRDTYRSMRLGEVLLDQLRDGLTKEGGPVPRYLLDGADNEAAERLERLLYRLGYQRIPSRRHLDDPRRGQPAPSAGE